MNKLLIALAALLSTAAIADDYMMAPDGSYVGGDDYTMAPDGSYVGGDDYTMAPDGRYVGE